MTASVFIPLAERMDLIAELGAHVLRTACADVARLRRSRDTAALRVSVNASAAELRDADYPARVEQACAEAGLPRSALRLEITESLTLDESEEVDRVLAELQALGVALSIDDFGTGYSSFSILTRVPWSEIKLDRSLTTRADPRKLVAPSSKRDGALGRRDREASRPWRSCKRCKRSAVVRAGIPARATAADFRSPEPAPAAAQPEH